MKYKLWRNEDAKIITTKVHFNLLCVVPHPTSRYPCHLWGVIWRSLVSFPAYRPAIRKELFVLQASNSRHIFRAVPLSSTVHIPSKTINITQIAIDTRDLYKLWRQDTMLTDTSNQKHDRAMAQAVSRRPLTAEARVRFRVRILYTEIESKNNQI
jgi:hypothetical protein